MVNDVLDGSWGFWLDDGSVRSGKLTFPEPNASATVVVKTLAAGICRSDIKELAGRRHGMRTFGHEFVGEVVETVGAGLRLHEGERVVLDPHVDVSRTSAFGTHIIVQGKPDIVNAALIPCGSVESVERYVLTEPLACAVHSICSLGQTDGRSIAIVGGGFYGVLLGLLLKRNGANVRILNRRHDRIDWLTRTFPNKFEVGELDATNFNGVEIVIDATAEISTDLTRSIARWLPQDGRIHLFGGTTPRPRDELSQLLDRVRRQEMKVYAKLCDRRLQLSGSHGATHQDFIEALRILADDRDQSFSNLLTRRQWLANLPAALRTVDAHRQFGKTIVLPERPTGLSEAIIRTPTTVRVESQPLPMSAEVVIRTAWVGLCGTDRQILDGRRPDRARVLGHEAVGTISSSSISKLPVGSVVICNPVSETNPASVIGHSAEGFLQSHVALRSAEIADGAIVRIDAVPSPALALAEPLAAVRRTVDMISKLDALSGQPIGILGSGVIAVLLALELQQHSTATYLITENTHRREYLRNRFPSLQSMICDSAAVASLNGEFGTVVHCASRRRRPLTLSGLMLRPGGLLHLVADAPPEREFETLSSVRRANASYDPLTVAEIQLDGKTIRCCGQRGTTSEQIQDSAVHLSSVGDEWGIITHTLSPQNAVKLLRNWQSNSPDPERNTRLKTLVDFTSIEGSLSALSGLAKS